MHSGKVLRLQIKLLSALVQTAGTFKQINCFKDAATVVCYQYSLLGCSVSHSNWVHLFTDFL